MMYLRVGKDLYREAGQGVLAESTEYYLPSSLARPLERKPANDNQYQAIMSI